MGIPRLATMLSIPLAAAAAAGVAQAGAEVGPRDPLGAHHTTPLPVSVSLEQCVSASEQEARSATFSGEMALVPGATRMEMRIDLLERSSEQEGYRRVTATGLGVWRLSAPGVKSFRYLHQVTDLAAPASYRGAVHFRWLNAHGKDIADTELRTRPCEQTVVAPPSPATGVTLN
ncbi:MAG TPA: hypothetical protein VMB91_05490 [Solirubrobacteraceae bacterium]|nr:hypothetical protein [Solirubrobacteraceae bacterium]